MIRTLNRSTHWLCTLGLTLATACGGSDSAGKLVRESPDGATSPDMLVDASGALPADGSVPSSPDSGDAGADAAEPTDAGTGGDPQLGWLQTQNGKIYVHTQDGLKRWMARGVNVDDIFLCGNNWNLTASDAADRLQAIVAGALTEWKSTFVRVSLGMNSEGVKVSWLNNDAQYKTPMTNIIKSIGKHPGAYALVTLRSDVTMVETNAGNEATYIPQTATDDVYRALVNSFAHDSFVIFGLSNEPGTIDSSMLVDIMSHAITTIRAEEDKLGVPHHLISVQGTSWTQDISFYAKNPLAFDNIVYEFHYYPVNGTSAASYTFDNIPVIIGEYGLDAPQLPAFYQDVEAKQIPNLAWDFEPYSNCAPDLLQVTNTTSPLTPSDPYGKAVKAYLTSH